MNAAANTALKIGRKLGWLAIPVFLNADGKWIPLQPYGHLKDEPFTMELWKEWWGEHLARDDDIGLGVIWPRDVVAIEADSEEATTRLTAEAVAWPATPAFTSARGPHYLFRGELNGHDPEPWDKVEVLGRPAKALMTLPPTAGKAWLPGRDLFELELARLPEGLPMRDVSATSSAPRELSPRVALNREARQLVQAYGDEALPLLEEWNAENAHADDEDVKTAFEKALQVEMDWLERRGAEAGANTKHLGRDEWVELARAAVKAGGLRFGPGGALYVYDGGVHKHGGDRWLNHFVLQALDTDFTTHRANQVRAVVKAANPADDIQPDDWRTDELNVANGRITWDREDVVLEPHTPDHPSLIQLPVTWEPSGTCPLFDEFLETVLPDEESIAFMWEWIGYLLIPTTKYQVALLLHGPGSTGKSTLLKVVEALLGHRNVSNRSLRELADDRFATASLFGKLANVNADLDALAPKTSNVFKAITGGDAIEVQRKFENAFRFESVARLMFSANEVPGTVDTSSGYFRRWLLLPMKHVITDVDPLFVMRLTEERELRGVLRHAVDGLRRLEARGGFEVPAIMQAELEAYRRRADTVKAFVDEECEIGPNTRTLRSEVYEAYDRWCHNNGRRPVASARFFERAEELHELIEDHRMNHGRYEDGITLRAEVWQANPPVQAPAWSS